MNICVIGGRIIRNATVKGTDRKILRFTVETRDGHEEGDSKERVNQVPCVLFGPSPELEQTLGGQGRVCTWSSRGALPPGATTTANPEPRWWCSIAASPSRKS